MESISWVVCVAEINDLSFVVCGMHKKEVLMGKIPARAITVQKHILMVGSMTLSVSMKRLQNVGKKYLYMPKMQNEIINVSLSNHRFPLLPRLSFPSTSSFTFLVITSFGSKNTSFPPLPIHLSVLDVTLTPANKTKSCFFDKDDSIGS